MVEVGTLATIALEGPAQIGDSVLFVHSLDNNVDCDDQRTGTVTALVQAGRKAFLSFVTPGRYILCYRFNFLEFDENIRPKSEDSFSLFADIQVAAIRIDYELASPSGTNSVRLST